MNEDPALCELALRERPCVFHHAIKGKPCFVIGEEGFVCKERINTYQHIHAPPADGPERHAGHLNSDA